MRRATADTIVRRKRSVIAKPFQTSLCASRPRCRAGADGSSPHGSSSIIVGTRRDRNPPVLDATLRLCQFNGMELGKHATRVGCDMERMVGYLMVIVTICSRQASPNGRPILGWVSTVVEYSHPSPEPLTRRDDFQRPIDTPTWTWTWAGKTKRILVVNTWPS